MAFNTNEAASVINQRHAQDFLAGNNVSIGVTPYSTAQLLQVTISAMFHKQLLFTKIPNVQKDTDDLSVFLYFWDRCVNFTNNLLAALYTKVFCVASMFAIWG